MPTAAEGSATGVMANIEKGGGASAAASERICESRRLEEPLHTLNTVTRRYVPLHACASRTMLEEEPMSVHMPPSNEANESGIISTRCERPCSHQWGGSGAAVGRQWMGRQRHGSN